MLDTTSNSVPRFNPKKWIEFYDKSGESYNINKKIRFKTFMLRSDIYACVVINGTITAEEADDRNKHNRSLILKSNAPFICCVSKINRTFIDNAKNLGVAMPMYNLIDYNKKCSKTSGTLWNYYKDILIDRIRISESFKYKASIIGKTANNGNTKEVKFSVPLKHLSNF